MTKYKSDDIGFLLPSLQKTYAELTAKMVKLGFDPVAWDTRRSAVEALRNSKAGVGILDSMHLYDAAVDTICGKHGWSCSKFKCDFFPTLRREGLALGLYRGPEADLPHLQGLPATKKAQDEMRALGVKEESRARRDALVRRYLERVL